MKMKEESEKAGLKLNIQKLRSWHPVLSLDGKQMGNNGNSERLYFEGAPKSQQMVTAARKSKDAARKKNYDKPRQLIKKQRHHFGDKGLYSQKLWFFQWSCMDMRVGL